MRLKLVLSLSLLMIIIGMFSRPTYAQLSWVQLYKQANGNFTTTRTDPPSDARIVTSRPIIVRARYYSRSSAPSILIMSFVDPVNRYKIRYPVALIEKNSSGEVILYGPQFYDGRKELQVIPELLVLKSEQYAKYKGIFDKYFGTAKDLLPVLGQASKFIDLGWTTAEEFFGKDKTELFQSVPIKRDSTQPLGTFPTWYVMANTDGMAAIQPLIASGFSDPTGGDRPGLSSPLSGGRVLFVSITPSDRAIDFDTIAQGMDEFFGSTKERLEKAKISTENPFSGEAVQSNLNIRRNFEVFLSMLELTRDIATTTNNNAMTTQDAITTLFGTFKAGQQQAPGTPFIKLKPAYEEQVAGNLTRLFDFKDSAGQTLAGDFEEPGLRSLLAWSNWYETRTDPQGLAPESIIFKTITSFASNTVPGGTYAVAKPAYGTKFATSLMPAAAPAATLSMKERLEAMKNNITQLRKIKAVFRSTDTNPWLRFEQRDAAKWLTTHLHGLPDSLPTADFKSDDDVKNFADKLDEFLATSKIFEPVDVTNKIWRFRPIIVFLTEVLNAEILRVGGDATLLNKHVALVDAYRRNIELALDSMTKEERDSLDSILAERFPKDLDGKSLATAAAKGYFDNTILDAVVESGIGQIKQADDAESMLKKIAFAQSTITSSTSELSDKLNVTKPALNLQRKNAMLAVFAFVRTSSNFSVQLKGVDFINKKVVGVTLPPSPTTGTDLTTWTTQMSPQLSNVQWDESKSRFVLIGGGNDPEVQDIKGKLDNGCIRSSAASMSTCAEPSGDPGVTGKDLISRLYEIICGVADNPAPKRTFAEDVLRGYIDVPPAVIDATSDKCSLYKNTYGLTKLEWKKGMYRLIPPPQPQEE